MKAFIPAVLLLLLSLATRSQSEVPFAQDIAAFRQADSIAMPAKNQILLIGSSSFTIWKDVQDYFPGYPILNRAFGGSTLADQIRYVDQVVFPYQPKQILIYCGENDLALSDTVTATTVVDRFKTLFSMIRERLPRTPVYFVSMKPSPSRQLLLSQMMDANERIRKFLSGKKRTAYIDVYHEMIDDEGKPKAELFSEDNLHMKKEGYLIWQRVIRPYLLK